MMMVVAVCGRSEIFCEEINRCNHHIHMKQDSRKSIVAEQRNKQLEKTGNENHKKTIADKISAVQDKNTQHGCSKANNEAPAKRPVSESAFKTGIGQLRINH